MKLRFLLAVQVGTNLNILVSSAAYIVADGLISSEGTSCLELLNEMMKNYGCSFHVIAGYVNLRCKPRNIVIHNVCSRPLKPYSNPVEKYLTHLEFITKAFLKSQKILVENQIDIVHHLFPAVFNQTFSPLALLRNLRKPFIFGPVSTHYVQRPIGEKLLRTLVSKLHAKTVSKCTRLIAINRHVKNLYSKIYGCSNISVIPLWVNTDVFKPSKRKDRKCFELLFAGSLYQVKGLEYLLKALALIVKVRSNVKLKIVGEGPERKRLEAIAKSLGIRNHIVFEGFVPYNKMPQYYQNCDVFCFPTLGEPFGKAVIEAMACGKPVVASNIGGPSEIIENYRNGVLAKPAQPRGWAQKIINLLEDEELRIELGKNARKTVLKNYSLKKVAQKFYGLYCEVLD